MILIMNYDKQCERETDPDLVSMCVKTPFDYVEDVNKMMDDKNLYYQKMFVISEMMFIIFCILLLKQYCSIISH